MAFQKGIFSYTIEDASGTAKAMPLYIIYDDTATLANLVAAIQEFCTQLDTLTDGKIIRQNITLSAALPGGLKANAVAGCDVQRTALLTFHVNGITYTYGQDVPAYVAAGFNGDNVNQSNQDYIDWTALMQTGDATGKVFAVEPKSGNVLTTVKSAVKKFRK